MAADIEDNILVPRTYKLFNSIFETEKYLIAFHRTNLAFLKRKPICLA